MQDRSSIHNFPPPRLLDLNFPLDHQSPTSSTTPSTSSNTHTNTHNSAKDPVPATRRLHIIQSFPRETNSSSSPSSFVEHHHHHNHHDLPALFVTHLRHPRFLDLAYASLLLLAIHCQLELAAPFEPQPPRRPPPTTVTMSFDWTHQFCLACDKQTDGATYCSESCRLADYDKTSPSTPSSGPSSPAFSGPSYQWTFSKPAPTSTKFYLSPAFDFSSSPTMTRGASGPALSPSSSHTSLSSIRSTSTAGLDATHMSDKAARELRAYARSFESVRLQRRRSA